MPETLGRSSSLRTQRLWRELGKVRKRAVSSRRLLLAICGGTMSTTSLHTDPHAVLRNDP